jgi:hypothetical protein
VHRIDAAAAQVEEGVLVELADRGAVRALDVVGVDLQLGAASASARRDSSRLSQRCMASVRWASWATRMRPVNTPRALPSSRPR